MSLQTILPPPQGPGTHPKVSFRPKPDIPRSVRAEPGSLEVLIFWNAPEDNRGLAGFRVYQTGETNLVYETADVRARSAKIKVAANTTDVFFISSFNELKRESAKIPVIGNSKSDKYVVTGTTGETSGTSANPYAEWKKEPSGGAGRYRYY